ncbi:hypothetical protein BMF94_3196 [Rhodotorula taiwanensis]|uniref:UBC core domain-containing protein n=1 Tax=Rhodotorula taiwanensis TaxID=741276 RepID=A0A2S5BAA8_9BASI|nr:hypothetical protein BMF94_3196 [Rhodotorula taiwanensis]
MATVPDDPIPPVLGEDGQPLSPKLSERYNEDVVLFTDKDGKERRAVVTRCWADEQNPEAVAEAARLGVPFTPLPAGYLEVLLPEGTRAQVLESTTTLIDKGFLRGDIIRARRAAGASTITPRGQLGQVVDLKTEVQLQRVLTGDEIEGWFPATDLVAASRINHGDHVVHGDWIGVVEEVFEMAMIEVGNNGIVRRVCDIGNTFSVGAATDTIKQMLLERGEGLLAAFLGATDFKRILDVKQCLVAVNWLCRNPQAPQSSDSAAWDRPKRFWTDIDQLTLVHAAADHLHSINDKVVFRDASLHPPAPSSLSETYRDGFRVLAIRNCRTTLEILWQDGTHTTASSTEFEQVAAVDEETDVFPGDVGVFSGVSPSKIGVVQSMDAKKRTIRLRYLDAKTCLLDPTDEEETISGLEFDPHGPPPDAYGVRRGDCVLLMPESETNGVQAPIVPGLGESEIAAGLMPAGEQLRIDLTSLGMSYCQTLSDSFVPPKAQEAPASLRWYGEVWNCLLSGEVEIRFPCGDKAAVPVPRIVHLDDGLDPEAGMGPMVGEDGMILEEEEDDAVSTDRSWETEDDADDGASVDEGEMSLDQDGVVSLVQGTFGEGEDDPEDSDFVMKDADGKPVKADEEDRREGDRRQSKRRRGHGPSTAQDEVKGWADEVDEPSIAAPSTSEAAATADATTAAATVQDAPAVAAAADDSVNAPTAVVSMPTETSDFEDWSRFGVLEEAPEDHHYYSERVLAPSKAFMSRIRKEHQVLATSLPPNILVRAYENRSDLLRCLIIGPLDTPFQNAPFLFDMYLSPQKFPNDPPQVYFHSWATGARVSPNLYVEGKVCLSLLGTWSGDQTENWSGARSSILQVFVSIQALIMVEAPYFTEPGFEKHMGTPEATAASELYNERTLVLTRAFVKRACEYPPSNFGREIAAYYYTGLPGASGGALQGIIDQSRRLLQESEEWHAEQEKKEASDSEGGADTTSPPKSTVVPSQRILTEGAGLSLRRTVKALEQLMERGPKLDPESEST